MPEEVFDVVIVGAGAAGICCAGELVLHGARPLLIAESAEVAYQFRSVRVGDGRAIAQLPTRNLYGEGGWWFSLARRLNIPVSFHRTVAGLSVTVEGSGVVRHLPLAPTAAAVGEMLAGLTSAAGDCDRAELERVLHAGLVMPAAELASLHDVPLQQWLEDLKTDDLVADLLTRMAVARTNLDGGLARDLVSVFGFFAPVRNYFCGDTEMCSIEPDAREGLFIPMACAVEGHGGSVWRGRRAARVLTEGGNAIGVVLEDGTEARAPVVAVATSNARIPALLEVMPPEVEAVRRFEASLGELSEHSTFALLEGLTDPHPRRMVITVKTDGSRGQIDWNITGLAPWATPPALTLMASEVVRPRAEVDALGGPAALHAQMRTVSEKLHPGYQDAIVATGSTQHPQIVTQYLVGPKLPQASPAIKGLWYVGEGAGQRDGTHVEGAASAGILGARAIIAARE